MTDLIVSNFYANFEKIYQRFESLFLDSKLD